MKSPPGALSFNLCIHLAQNHGAAIFSGEICKRWGIHPGSLSRALKLAMDQGYIERFKVHGERQWCYSAGRKLREAA